MTTPAVGGAGFAGPAIRQPVSGLFTVSDFESKSHEELRAMVAQASPPAAAELSRKLADAAKALSEIGDDLKKHTAHVAWEGEGGEAFRTWGSDLANATQRLSAFSGTAGTWMGHAAETLARVHSSMPEVSTGARTVLDAYRGAHPGQVGAVAPPLSGGGSGGGDLQGQGPTQQQAYTAQQRLDSDRAEAARLMRQLAESYSWSAHNMQGAERPVFPPAPRRVLPNDQVDMTRHIPNSRPIPGISGGAYSSGEPSVAELGTSSVSNRQPPEEHPGFSAPSATRPDSPVASRVDAVTATSDTRTVRPDMPTALGQVSGKRVSTSPVPPIVAPFADIRAGSTQLPGHADPTTGTPGRIPAGQGGVTSRSIPCIPGGSSGDGIVGGRPTPRVGCAPSGSVPRGTVVGAEPAEQRPQTHIPASYSPGAGSVGGTTGSGQQAEAGRRLATERGGIAGGRPQQRAGAADHPFTPGGAGLVRGSSETERNRRRPRGSQRPDYVVEDEATWVEGRRRVVPPVID